MTEILVKSKECTCQYCKLNALASGIITPLPKATHHFKKGDYEVDTCAIHYEIHRGRKTAKLIVIKLGQKRRTK